MPNNTDIPNNPTPPPSPDSGTLSCADSGAPFEQTNEVLFFDALSGIDADILAMPAFGEGLAICRCCGATKAEHHAKGAISSVNVLGNSIGVEQAQELQDFVAHAVLSLIKAVSFQNLKH
jgi:hypothetical protein